MYNIYNNNNNNNNNNIYSVKKMCVFFLHQNFRRTSTPATQIPLTHRPRTMTSEERNSAPNRSRSWFST